MIGTCPITSRECELQESHIYPKFMWEFLKKTGGDKFRSIECPTKIIQNGEKIPLLSKEAEEMFCKHEKWFAERIFIPFCTKKTSISQISYQKELYFFTISLLWRRLYTTIDYIIDPHIKDICQEALEEWRKYLSEGKIPCRFSEIYIMPITPDCFNLPPIYEIDSYILRDFDTELFIHDNSNVAYFCKTPRFFFWATIKRDNTNLNYGIKINPNRGKINLKKYKVGDGYVKGYILSRIKKVSQIYNQTSQKLSDVQINKIIERTVNRTSFRNSELETLLSLKANQQIFNDI